MEFIYPKIYKVIADNGRVWEQVAYDKREARRLATATANYGKNPTKVKKIIETNEQYVITR